MATTLESSARACRFLDLCASVQHCTLCERLTGRTKVLSNANGNIDSKVLFVAEAPGRLGADRTGIPLCGDQTGRNFEVLLGNIGWAREEVFVTNSLLCNPRQANGNNATPSPDEIANCSAYLDMAIELVDPEVVVSLGATALAAVGHIAPHGRALKSSVATRVPWAGRVLFPLYHPGPRARVHRSLPKQRSDFMRLAKLVSPTKGLLKAPRRAKVRKMAVDPDRPSVFQQLILAIAQALGRTTYFKLTKLLYLTDLLALGRLGRTLSHETYLRQADGPWPPTIQRTVPSLDGYEIRRFFRGRVPMIAAGPSPRYKVDLSETELAVLADTLERYGRLSNASIKTAVYRTKPMRYILAAEKEGRDMRRFPVIHKDRAASVPGGSYPTAPAS